MRSSLALALFMLLAMSNTSIAQTTTGETEQIKLAMNNAAHEFATCGAYFLIVSVALENSKELEVAAKYKATSDQSLQFALSSAKVAGLLPETTAARFENDFLMMSKRIGGNTSNVSILFKDYADLCQRAMEDPAGRLKEWVEKIQSR